MIPSQLVALCPKIPQNRITPLLLAMDMGGINTPMRQAAFIAQCGHESRDFTKTEENLMYSTERLLQVFPKYFKTREEAARVAQNPEAIANIVYSNRMGNGAPQTGDGYRFRGRGYIQLTGRDNYTKFAIASATPADRDPSIVTEPDGAALSAVWFWNKNSLNKLADIGAMTEITRRINGGIMGLDDRMQRYEKALKVLKT